MELLTAPSHLWIGSQSNTKSSIIRHLQQHWCSYNSCARCSVCTAIAQEQHHAIIWLRPKNFYTRETLEPLFDQIIFALNRDEHFFFVLENIDYMPSSCANSLLKSLEEPPAGYHFYLAAERLEGVLPTIRSRSIIHQLDYSHYKKEHPLLAYFINEQRYDPIIFLKELELCEINERESIALVDHLFIHWAQLAKQAILVDDQSRYSNYMQLVSIVTDALAQLPMPGSSKLFWKNFYLSIKAVAK